MPKHASAILTLLPRGRKKLSYKLSHSKQYKHNGSADKVIECLKEYFFHVQ